MNDDIVRFFSRSTHCKPEVVRRIVTDMDTLCNSLCLSRKVTTWGTTEQPKICLYGGIPVSFPFVAEGELGEERRDHVPELREVVLPIQIWLTHQFPIEPPVIYLVSMGVSGSSKAPTFSGSAVVKIVSNHPNVDLTGLCFCKELAEWRPATSSLCFVVERLGKALEKSERCPLYVDESAYFKTKSSLSASSQGVGKNSTDDEIDGCLVCYGDKDTVLVPCGHFCMCVSCAANVTECPLCRVKIKVRQRIFN